MTATVNRIPPDAAQELRTAAGSFFKPASPIRAAELFSGRMDQLERTFDAINQSGQHVILFGERGVGKTSLANVLALIEGANLISAKTNCDATDTFSSAWRKVLNELTFVVQKREPGFTGDVVGQTRTVAENVTDNATPAEILTLLRQLPSNLVLIFDEFDRLKPEHGAVFADLVKALSDYDIDATLVLVGVADTVNQLITDHASIDRSLVQIHMPRMREKELLGILKTGTAKLNMTISTNACQRIVTLSQGLPHYTHLLGLTSARAALADMRVEIGLADVDEGLKKAVDGAQQSIKSTYHQATRSARSDALFEQVLTACALADKDSLSYFQAADVVSPLSGIMDRRYNIPAFARHLREFCDGKRGPVLERIGEERNFRYRFVNPLIEPFVIMKGMANGFIAGPDLNLPTV